MLNSAQKILIACLLTVGSASADNIYSIYFTATDGSGVTAFGSITVAGGFATSGTIDFEGPGWLTFPGIYTLSTDYSETAEQGGFGNLPGDFTSPNGYFYFNNAFSGTSPNIDEAGLLFTMQVPGQQIFDNGSLITGTLTAEASLWWDGSQFIIADDFNGPAAILNGSGFPFDADQSPDGQYEFTGNFSETAAPEPATTLLMATGVAFLFGMRRRTARRNRCRTSTPSVTRWTPPA